MKNNYKVEVLSKSEFANYNGERLLKVITENSSNQSNDVVSSFYSILTKKDYINFLIDAFLGGGNYRYDINFYQGPEYEEELSVAYNEVIFWVFTESQIISEDNFWDINLNFARKLLVANDFFNSSELDKQFRNGIMKIIPSIERKIIRLNKRNQT